MGVSPKASGSDDVLACLTNLFTRQGPLDHIRLDNGHEFVATAVGFWAVIWWLMFKPPHG